MIQNLRSCRQKIETWQIINANVTVYPVSFEHIIDQSANKIPYDSLSNLKSY